MAAADGSFPLRRERPDKPARAAMSAVDLDTRLADALIRGGLGPSRLAALRRQTERQRCTLAAVIERGPASFATSATAALANATHRMLALPGLDRALPGQDAAAAIGAGMIRLDDGRLAVVPTGSRLEGLLAEDPPAAERIALATPQTLLDLAVAADGVRLVDRATQTLARRDRDLSCRGGARPWQRWTAALFAAALGLALIDAKGRAALLMAALGAVFFLAVAIGRFLALMQPAPPHTEPCLAHPDHLPLYTILVPLYREATAVTGLVESLSRLDYPTARLDVLFLVEADDRVTLTAFDAIDLPAGFRLVRLPAGGPRTKPRACNIGLALARGTFLVVFDAEDRPEPLQLRQALAMFREGGRDLAVVQARLAIDPRQQGWLPALFRADYAGLFNVLLPALARFDLPIPLGGTSNHFRTEILRRVGGWDAYNVTEDADLGLRFDRLGYRAAMMSATTLEEAPSTPAAWLRQRTRWLKGWMVTMIVHSRDPARLLAEIGPAGALAFFLMTGGIVAASLLGPISLLFLVRTFASGLPDDPLLLGLRHVCLASLLLGHGVAIAVAIRGSLRLGRMPNPFVIALFPLYWCALSIAAWRALFQLARDPHGWEKTEHVLARRPRRRSEAQRPGGLGIGEEDGRPMRAP